MITGEQVYLPAFKSGHSSITVEGSEFHHLVRVRRFEVADEVWLVNGFGVAALARIVAIREADLDLKIIHEAESRGELDCELTLAVANLKGDHLNLIVEKATELGVRQIIPLLTDHTIKKGINRNRLERIAIAAMKQSRRSYLPKIHDLTPYDEFVEKSVDGLSLFCHASDTSLPLVSNRSLKKSKQINIFIGPEGDWSKDEIDLASVSDYTFTGLGPRRLRAETAAIHAVGLVSALLQDPA